RNQPVEPVGHGGWLPGQLALTLAERRDLGGERVLRRAPRGVRGIEIGVIPFELVRNLRSVAFLRADGERQADECRGCRHQPNRGCLHGAILRWPTYAILPPCDGCLAAISTDSLALRSTISS